MSAVDEFYLTAITTLMRWDDEGQHPVYDAHLEDVRVRLAGEWLGHQTDVALGRSEKCTFDEWFATEGADRPTPFVEYMAEYLEDGRAQQVADRRGTKY